MKTIWKMLAISVAAGFVLAVLGVAFGASQSVYLDKTGVHLVTYEPTQINEPDLGSFENIDINVAYSNVRFISADKFGMDIDSGDGNWDWSLNGGTLKIAQNQESKSRISLINFDLDMSRRSSIVTIYLPQEASLSNIFVKTGSGDIDIGGFSASDVQIKNSFGKVSIAAVTSEKLKIEMSSGDFKGSELNAQNIEYKSSFGKGRFEEISAQKMVVESNSGDVRFTGCVAGDIDIKNSFGKIIAERLYSSKTYIRANSGDIVLSGDFSGETVIRSSFGKVDFSTSREKAYYSCDISVDFGKLTIDGEKQGNNTKLKNEGSSENILKIDANSGDVEVNFVQ